MFILSFSTQAEDKHIANAMVNVLLSLAFVVFGSSPGWSATPIGTVIENTAQITYTTVNLTNGSFDSNTDQFTVEGTGQIDRATMSVVQTPMNLSPCAGDTLTFDITINNIGDNVLASAALLVTIPKESTITLEGGERVVGSETFDNSMHVPTVTYTFSVPDIPSFETQTEQAIVTQSLDVQCGCNTDISFELVANGKSIVTIDNPITFQARTESTMELLFYDANSSQAPVPVMPTQYDNGSSFVAIDPPSIPDDKNVLVTDHPVPLSAGVEFNYNQPMFFRVVDPDQNLDPAIQDTIEINLGVNGQSETETLRLTETTPDNGIFTGYIYISCKTGGNNNGILNVTDEAQITVSYRDDVDSSDSTVSVVLVDPFGVIFDSATGALLDGFTVRLANAITGQDATIYGDDGVSLYPAIISSGGTTTDAAGTVYNFPPGSYRFPFVAPGQYYLEITPPAGGGYHFPTVKSNGQLAGVPNGPFVIDVGSRGETFSVVAGPPLNLDIPVDPSTSPLYVRRTASKPEVEQGDFMQFMVSIENTTSVDMVAGILTDTLPQGFRYQQGSARFENAQAEEPQISEDGRTLSFSLGALAAETTYGLRYVVAIGAAPAGLAESGSMANANGGAAASNVSTVTTQVRNAFMRDHNILVGQVKIHNVDGSQPQEGLAGVRIYMEDGTYTITDNKGKYHFEGVTPGTHVVQIDLDTLPGQYEIIPFEKNTRFAGRAWSQFVDLQGGTLWRVDFHAALKGKPQGNLLLQLANDAQNDPDILRYRLSLRNQTVPLSNLKLIMMLPDKFAYTPGSSRLGEKEIPDPQVTDNILTYRLASLAADLEEDLILDVSISGGAAEEMITKLMILFDTPEKKNQRSELIEHRWGSGATEPVRNTKDYVLHLQFDTRSAALKDESKKELDRLVQQHKNQKNIHITATGHTDDRPIRPENKKYFANNKVLSEQRALAVADYLREALHLTPAEITVIGKGSSAPIADNSVAEGRAANRRVELAITGESVNPSARHPKSQFRSEPLEIKTSGRLPGNEAAANNQSGQKETATKIYYDEQWLNTAAPGIEFLSPAQGDLPAIPNVTVAIKHESSQRIELYLNNSPVPPTNFNGTAKNRSGTAMSRWSGVDLVEGDNRLDAVILAKDGSKLQTISRTIHYSAPPVNVELITEQSVLTADGVVKPVIALRLTDKDGYPARLDCLGEYRLNSPYKAALENEKFDPALLPGSPANRLTYKIGEDGIAKIELAPTTEAGEVRITLPLMNSDHLIKARLTAPTRDWIIVGFAEGTVGYNTLSGKKTDLAGNAAEEHLYNDGQVAFFAKGRILGKWLLTMAYNSDKPDLKREKSLFQTVDPGTYYTVYGDSSRQDYEAASREKLYLKLERDVFYLLFGDYTTDLSQSRLSTYNRALTGLKSEYHQNGFDVVAFASQSNQAFIRDELQGKGISGPYPLSRSTIVMNSEQVVIETRDRFHSERILESRQMARHTDYNIDYDKGTITFRETVMQSDSALNLNFIVIKYESFDDSDEKTTFGGHVQKQFGEKITLGLSHINEGRTGGEAKLTGGDFTVHLTDDTLVRAEMAHSTEADNGGSGTGNAYIAEIEHRADKWGGKAYYKETDTDFGLGQTNGSESGTRKIGGDIFVDPLDNLRVSLSANRDTNLETGANRDVIEADGNLQISQNDFHLGGRTVRDELGDNSSKQSNQIIAGVSRKMLDNRLKVFAEREQSVDSDESVDYPTVTRVGADYLLTEKTKIQSQHEWSDADKNKAQYTQVGLSTTPWSGGEIFTGVQHNQAGEAANTAADVALKQKWDINDMLSMDFSIEKSKILGGQQVAPLSSKAPFAYGSSGDYTATSVGATYNPGKWIWSGRVERRDGKDEDGWNLATSVQTDPSSELSLLSSAKVFDSQTNSSHRKNGDFRIDLAYRPSGRPWTVLDRLELITETNNGSDSRLKNWRIVNNLNANLYNNDGWQLALQLGLKYVQETIDKIDYNGITSLYGGELRYDINEKWDIGFQACTLHSLMNNQFDYSSGISIGHSIMENVWLSIGYNIFGFEDRDFSSGRSTSQGIFFKFRVKFDQQSVEKGVEKVKKVSEDRK